MDIISRKLANDMIYAYHNGRFWRWDDTQSVWKESHLMAQKFGRAKAASATLTPEVFLTDGAQFVPLDDYEIDIAMMDALKDAKPCKTAPIDPVEEEASPVSAVAPPADVAEPFGNTPAAPTFDFGADDQTNAMLLQDAQTFITGNMARIMAAKHAHDLTANHYKGSWGKWCTAVGISRDTGDRMVSVAAQCGNIQLEGKSIFDVQPMKLLYAAAKPSTPEAVKQAVFSGDITTYKEYQDIMGQLKAEQARADRAFAEIGDKEKTIQSLLNRSEEADARADEAESRYKAALADVTGLQEQYSQMSQRANDAEEARIAARLQCQKAECERDKAEQRAKDAEAALKKQPITAVVDEEEVDKRAHQQAYAIAADMTSELREQLEAAQSAPPVDPQEDIETATSCIVNITGIWSMATPTFTRLVGIGEEFDQLADALLQTCDRIKKEVIAMIAENDGGLKDE